MVKIMVGLQRLLIHLGQRFESFEELQTSGSAGQEKILKFRFVITKISNLIIFYT